MARAKSKIMEAPAPKPKRTKRAWSVSKPGWATGPQAVVAKSEGEAAKLALGLLGFKLTEII